MQDRFTSMMNAVDLEYFLRNIEPDHTHPAAISIFGVLSATDGVSDSAWGDSWCALLGAGADRIGPRSSINGPAVHQAIFGRSRVTACLIASPLQRINRVRIRSRVAGSGIPPSPSADRS